MDDLSGQSLKGYEVQERIGKGGFGAVYRAHQPVVDREVAVKVILPQYANQPDFIRRFETEAQLVARLEHLHIVPLYDYWRDPDGAYLVMRFMRGGSLHDWLKRGALEPDVTLRVLEQIASALALAHRYNVIHRDVKPGNILLDEEQNAYLTDFGIAKVVTGKTTGEGSDEVSGSLEYVAPEQLKGEKVTPQSDIYSLGLVLYEMLTGEHAFSPSTTPSELVYNHLETPLPDVHRQRTGIPTAVSAVIHKATSKESVERFADTEQLVIALRESLAIAELVVLPEGDVDEYPLVEALTDRELEILQLIAQGLSNREIAGKLVLELSTIKWHNRQIFGKLGVRRRREAVAVARQRGLLEGKPRIPTAVLQQIMPVAPNPYKGLRPFQQADANDFFGREALTQQLLARLAERGDSARFLAVIGPSGSGKSSGVKAGLFPALRKGALPGSENWFIAEMLPGTHPLEELEIALLRIAVSRPPSLIEQLTRDARGLLRAARLIIPDDSSEVLLLVDQFEELFVLAEDKALVRYFLDLIVAAVTDPRSRVRVVITLRADFYDRPLMYPQSGELVRQRTEAVVPLTPEELEQAIVKPARQAGVTVEPGLVAAMVADVNEQPGALPLLQYVLTELYDRREGRNMTLATYNTLGGTLGALAKQADELMEDLNAEEQEVARQLFLRLVTLGEGTEDVRRRVQRTELTAIGVDSNMMDDIIDTFGEYRMLTFDRDPQTRGPTVEVTHEALIRGWGHLRRWVDESRDDVRLQRLLGEAASEWYRADKDVSFLLHGVRLARFEDWADTTTLVLIQSERAYLDACIAERERQRAKETERQALEQISLELAQSFDLEKILQRALVVSSQATGAEDGLICVFDLDTDRLRCQFALNPAGLQVDDHQDRVVHPAENLANELYQKQKEAGVQEIVIDDLKKDRHGLGDKLGPTEWRSAMALQLVSYDDVQGMILFLSGTAAAFSRAQLDSLVPVVKQMSTVFMNRELFQLIHEQAERIGMYAALLEKLDDGVLFTGVTGEVILYNARAEDILNLSGEHIAEQPLAILADHSIEAATRWEQAIRDWSESREVVIAGFEERICLGKRMVNVRIYPVPASAALTSDTNGETSGFQITGAVLIFHDLTDYGVNV